MNNGILLEDWNPNIVNTEGNNVLLQLFKSLGHILITNNMNDEELSSIISKVVEIIDIFKQQPINFMIKNLENQNLLQVATFAITQDQQLNKNLTQEEEEEVNSNPNFQDRLNMYDFIIRSFIFDNESITDEDGPDDQPGMSAQMYTLSKGYIGNFIDSIFKEKLNQKLNQKLRRQIR